MAAQWIALAITAAGTIWGFATMWTRFSERLDYMKGEIIQLQREAQTQEEREALAAVVETRCKAREEKADLRFDTIIRLIEQKLDKILVTLKNGQ